MGITQRKGDLAAAQAIATFTRIGFIVFVPVVTESAQYDLIVDITGEGELKRVQVKYTSSDVVRLTRIHSNSKGYVVKRYEPNSYDWLYALKADGREYLIRQCLTGNSIVLMEEELIEHWQEPIPNRRMLLNRGVRHGQAKLSEEDVLTIRQLASEGMSQRQLAKQFEVSKAAVEAILSRRSWDHL